MGIIDESETANCDSTVTSAKQRIIRITSGFRLVGGVRRYVSGLLDKRCTTCYGGVERGRSVSSYLLRPGRATVVRVPPGGTGTSSHVAGFGRIGRLRLGKFGPFTVSGGLKVTHPATLGFYEVRRLTPQGDGTEASCRLCSGRVRSKITGKAPLDALCTRVYGVNFGKDLTPFCTRCECLDSKREKFESGCFGPGQEIGRASRETEVLPLGQVSAVATGSVCRKGVGGSRRRLVRALCRFS